MLLVLWVEVMETQSADFSLSLCIDAFYFLRIISVSVFRRILKNLFTRFMNNDLEPEQ